MTRRRFGDIAGRTSVQCRGALCDVFGAQALATLCSSSMRWIRSVLTSGVGTLRPLYSRCVISSVFQSVWGWSYLLSATRGCMSSTKYRSRVRLANCGVLYFTKMFVTKRMMCVWHQRRGLLSIASIWLCSVHSSLVPRPSS